MRRLGACVQFEIPILGVSLIQVLDSFGQVPLLLILQIPGAVTVSDGLCPATRSDRGSTAGLHFIQLLSQLQERAGSAFRRCTLEWGRFDRCRWRTLRLKNAWEWVEVSAETVELNS